VESDGERSEGEGELVVDDRSPAGSTSSYERQTEIAKRLNAICAQVIPFLSQEHQQQVAAAVERAKQVTTSELNAIIGFNQQSFNAAVGAAGIPPPFLPPTIQGGIPPPPQILGPYPASIPIPSSGS
jgi:hypothetical protein